MKRTLLPAVVVLMSATTATAQSALVAANTTETVSAAVAVSDDCVMKTSAEAWTSLGLSKDQLTKVQEIQSVHRKECGAMKAEEKAEDKAELAEKHQSQIKEVLTADQYNKWLAWCAQQPARTDKPTSK